MKILNTRLELKTTHKCVRFSVQRSVTEHIVKKTLHRIPSRLKYVFPYLLPLSKTFTSAEGTYTTRTWDKMFIPYILQIVYVI